MKIKEQIESKINELGYQLGCYDTKLDEILTKKALNQVLENLEYDWKDLFLRIRKKLYIVSISTVDLEKDVVIYSDLQYFTMFNNLQQCLDTGDITQADFDRLSSEIGYIW